MQSFAEDIVSYPGGQTNVVQPPDALLDDGFVPETVSARGQTLPAQWLNWLFRTAFRYINRDKVSDATGTGLFTTPDAFITFKAFDRADPNKYLVAEGYKPASGVHTLKVVASATLTLGTATEAGNQPVVGGADVITVGYSRQFGDL